MRNILKKKQVMERVGLSAATIWRQEKAGLFPNRVLLTERRVGWFEDEIDAWMDSRVRFNQRS